MQKTLILGILALAVALVAGRYYLLLRATASLGRTSAAFPKDYWVGSPSDPELTYAVLGDSTVEGTGVDRVEDTLPYRIAAGLAAARSRHVHVLNFAHTGDTMAKVLRDQAPRLAAAHPDVVTLNCGANDATHFVDYGSYATDLRAVISAMRGSEATRFIIATAPDLSPTPSLPYVYRDIVAGRAARENAILTSLDLPVSFSVVDLYGKARLTLRSQYAGDEFHPSAEGYALWFSLYAGLLG